VKRTIILLMLTAVINAYGYHFAYDELDDSYFIFSLTHNGGI